MFFALMVMLTTTMAASAMSYEQARSEALFLTDKMAYELNLTDEQYEAAYEINLDYLMGVTGRADVFGTYWERRNLDLSYILLDWQWSAYLAANYFYRPLYWEAGYWHFGVYRRYPHRDYFYFGIFMADMATTTDAGSTSVHPQERTSACTTVGTVATSAHLTTALHASQRGRIMAVMEVGSAAMPQATTVQ